MKETHSIGKRDFIQHTSKYLHVAEIEGELIITHQNKPALRLTRIEEKTVDDLRGTIKKMRVEGDINDPIFPGYDEW